MIEVRKEGQPYENESAARMAAGRREKEEGVGSAKPIEIEGGWGIDVVLSPTANRVRRKRQLEGADDPTYIPEHLREPGYAYRIVNTDDERWANRLHKLENEDWAIVRDGGKAEVGRAGQGGKATRFADAVTLPVGRGVTGVLMRKPMEWFDEDKAEKKDKRRKVRVNAIKANAENFVGKVVDQGDTVFDNYDQHRGRP